GKRPFDDEPFDIGLLLRICQGERPKCALGTPNHYKQFLESDMNKPETIEQTHPQYMYFKITQKLA
ncbi:11130_t:CDS:2, partial [Gigaspora margarita]